MNVSSTLPINPFLSINKTQYRFFEACLLYIAQESGLVCTFLPLGNPRFPSALTKNMSAEHPSEYGGEILPLHPLYDRKVVLSYHIKKEACTNFLTWQPLCMMRYRANINQLILTGPYNNKIASLTYMCLYINVSRNFSILKLIPCYIILNIYII